MLDKILNNINHCFVDAIRFVMVDKLSLPQTRSPTIMYSSCVDIDGKIQLHGRYYTPSGSTPCTQCLCNNGHPGVCIAITCQKPKCQKYKQISGKCCDYKCHDNIDFTDKATLAIVIPSRLFLCLL